MIQLNDKQSNDIIMDNVPGKQFWYVVKRWYVKKGLVKVKNTRKMRKLLKKYTDWRGE